MSVVGVRKAASEGRLPSRRTGSGQRVFDRTDLDAYLGRPPALDKAPVDRVEALYCRVSGSTGRESSLADQESMLRESASGVVYRVYKGSRFWCEGNAGRCGPDARRRRRRRLHGGAGGVAGIGWPGSESPGSKGICRWSGLRSRSCGSMATSRWWRS
ncbi:hypothetical protein L1080_035130 [Rhodococcus sp. MSC1_016]|uniref:hypothetical protein n=1 Tax=Rhodococcus sp. MSC1_016 TaxID=2909266 RepID=UPI00202E9841|nr:hypothetical protein [Rhodococcus sp. MSC1_016]